jgi:radical SAM protein with 4Fe4S-binding SPASM domain
MTATLDAPATNGPSFTRSLRPEAKKDADWQSPEDFFKTVRYVTMKITNGCNLKCNYCNVEADLPSTPKMSMERCNRISELLITNSRERQLSQEFHGGEPLLFPDEWFEEAIGYAQRLAKKHGKIVEHPMQTNGTRLSEQRLEKLLKLGVHIGISFDGPPHINDRHRMAGKRVEQTLRMLVEKRAPFGMILVLSPSNFRDMPEVMEYFRTLGVPGFRVNFMQPQGHGMDQNLLTGEEMFQGMKAVFDHMAATDCSVMEADMQLVVNRYVRGRLSNAPLSCWELQCQAGRAYCAINIHGDVYACGTDMFHHRLGHMDDGFAREHVKESLCSLHHKDPWYVRCFGCEARRICAQSCPTSDHNNLTYREAECDYTRRLFQYFKENDATVRRVFNTIGKKIPHGNMMR